MTHIYGPLILSHTSRMIATYALVLKPRVKTGKVKLNKKNYVLMDLVLAIILLLSKKLNHLSELYLIQCLKHRKGISM